MGRLERFAKEASVPVVQKTVRIPDDIYRKFEKIFTKYGMSFNEAVNCLIVAEIEEVEQEKKARKKEANKE